MRDNSTSHFGLAIRPRHRVTLNREVPSNLENRVHKAGLDVHWGEEGGVRWTVVDEDTQEILKSGRDPLTPLKLTQEGIPGQKSDVLPNDGRLVALLQYVQTAEEMEAVCWAVLRRYASVHGWGTMPSRGRRILAYRAIKTAWKRANTPDELRHIPFWSGAIPAGTGVMIRTTECVEIWPGIIQRRAVARQMPLDDLLDPKVELQQ